MTWHGHLSNRKSRFKEHEKLLLQPVVATRCPEGPALEPVHHRQAMDQRERATGSRDELTDQVGGFGGRREARIRALAWWSKSGVGGQLRGGVRPNPPGRNPRRAYP